MPPRRATSPANRRRCASITRRASPSCFRKRAASASAARSSLLAPATTLAIPRRWASARMPATSPSASRSDQRAETGAAVAAGRGPVDCRRRIDRWWRFEGVGTGLRSRDGRRAGRERRLRHDNHPRPVESRGQRLSAPHRHGITGARAIDGDDAALHLEIEARLGCAPLDEERGAVDMDEEGPRLNLPIRAGPMGDVHMRAPVLENQPRAASADVEDPGASARQHSDVGSVREGELRLVPR